MKRRGFLATLLLPFLPTPQLPWEQDRVWHLPRFTCCPPPNEPSIRELLEANSMKEPVEGFELIFEEAPSG